MLRWMCVVVILGRWECVGGGGGGLCWNAEDEDGRVGGWE